MKQIDVSSLDEEGRRASEREVSILSSLAHPGVIQHLESFEEAGKLCIVTEFAAGGDLARRLSAQKGAPLAEATVLAWAVELLLTLHYLHARKILHRDIKLQNIFLAHDAGLRLGDFGIARVLKHTFENARSIVGTPYYISPELAASKPYNAKSDVWAAGCVLYELCAQRHAFEASSIPTLVRKILRGKFAPLPTLYSEDLRALVTMMLSHSPAARPPVSAILQLPFLRPYILDYARRCAARGHPLPPQSLPEELRSLLRGASVVVVATADATAPVADASDDDDDSRAADIAEVEEDEEEEDQGEEDEGEVARGGGYGDARRGRRGVGGRVVESEEKAEGEKRQPAAMAVAMMEAAKRRVSIPAPAPPPPVPMAAPARAVQGGAARAPVLSHPAFQAPSVAREAPPSDAGEDPFVRWLLSARLFEYRPEDEETDGLDRDGDEDGLDLVVSAPNPRASGAEQLESLRSALIERVGKGVAVACVCAMRAALRRDSEGREATQLQKARVFASALRPLDRVQFTTPRGLGLLRATARIVRLESTVYCVDSCCTK